MRISVICPVHNTPAALLQAATNSVLRESVAQLVLVDDASSSIATQEALAALAQADRRVLVLRSPHNLGPASARNLGINSAIGDWIGFLDSDDLWLPGRIDVIRAVLAAHPGVEWIGGGHGQMAEDGILKPSPRLPHGSPHLSGLHCFNGADFTRLLISNFWMHLGAMAVSRSLLQRAGGFAEGLWYGEDVHLMARLSTLAPLYYAASDVYAWRRGHASLTNDSKRLRLTSLSMYAVAAQDPLLRDFQREVRWARYSALKGLALNNLLAGQRVWALSLALRAWALDPREIGDLRIFFSLIMQGTAEASRYSQAEHFVVQKSA